MRGRRRWLRDRSCSRRHAGRSPRLAQFSLDYPLDIRSSIDGVAKESDLERA
jgi:hypothetical protein